MRNLLPFMGGGGSSPMVEFYLLLINFPTRKGGGWDTISATTALLNPPICSIIMCTFSFVNTSFLYNYAGPCPSSKSKLFSSDRANMFLRS